VLTGYIHRDPSAKDDDRDVPQFEAKAEKLDAASCATDGPKRNVRERQSTGFERKKSANGILDDEFESRALQFNDGVEQFDAASSASGEGKKRSLRQRVNTGFAWMPTESRLDRKRSTSEVTDAIADDDELLRRGVGFGTTVEEFDAASGASTGPKRDVRKRINTGFAREDDVPKTKSNDGKGLQFKDGVEEFDAASSASSAPKRDVRKRINTGFAREDDVPKTDPKDAKGLQFHDGVEELDAASSASSAPKRDVRKRINTGFAREDDVPKDQKGLQFNDGVEEFDAASSASSGQKRDTRKRINTGFARKEDVVRHASKEQPREVQVASNVEILDAASVSAGPTKRDLRDRQSTGFEHKEMKTNQKSAYVLEAFAVLDNRGTKLIRQAELASVLVPLVGTKKADRLVAAYVKDGTAPVGTINIDYNQFVQWLFGPLDSLKLQFNVTVQELDAASEVAKTGSKRNLRQRVGTGFLFEAPPEDARKPIMFDDKAEELEAASTAAESGRRLRDRVNTGFLFESDASQDSDRKPMFDDTAEELDAASGACESGGRVRDRVNTGFSFEKPVDPSARRPLMFDDNAEQLDAASSAAETGRRVRDRVNTGFAREDEGPMDERKPLMFNDVAEQLDAASSAAETGRRVRDRVNTGFAREDDVPMDERKPLMFNDVAEQLDAASSAAETGRRVRDRVNTGFARDDDVPKDERTPLKFNDDAEELEAASSATETGRRVRDRVNTGFAKEDEVPKESTPLKFNFDAEELEAASIAAETGRRVRDRVNTGFAFESDNIGDDPMSPTASEQWPSPKFTINGDEASFEVGARPSDGASCTGSRPSGGCLKSGLSSDRPSRTAQRVSLTETNVEELLLPIENINSTRSSRMRICTGFNTSEAAESEDEDDEALTVADAAKKRLSAAQERRRSTRSASIKLSLDEKRKLQHVVIGMEFGGQLTTGPEAFIDTHEVVNADKDEALLTQAIRPMEFFNELDDEVIEELVDAFAVYEFDNGEHVLEQGDIGGSHFYVVGSGKFWVVKDGIEIIALTAGQSFGESVLLVDGIRKATVRAETDEGAEKAIAYALEAQDVRDALRYYYEERHKDVMAAVENILNSDACTQLSNLNSYQLHTLFKGAEVLSFVSGDVIVKQGRHTVDTIFVHVSGAIVLRKGEQDLKRVKRHTMFGIQGFLFGYMPYALVADGSTKVLAVARDVIEHLFDADELHKVFLTETVSDAFQSSGTWHDSHLSDNQTNQLVETWVVREITPDKPLDTTDVRLVMGLNAGEFEVIKDGKSCMYQGQPSDIFGVEHLLNPEMPWDGTEVRATADGSTYVAVWYGSATDGLISGLDRNSEIVRVLRGIFLFRTLGDKQLQGLADTMITRLYADEEVIIQQGAPGDSFCIIGKGQVEIEKSGRFIRILNQGDYFGERALLTAEPRAATCKASNPCEIWTMTKNAFIDMLPQAAIDYLIARSHSQDAEYSFEDLEFIAIIGTGGFGTVKMVQTNKKGEEPQRYAMKCIRKQVIVENNLTMLVTNERNVLEEIDHPFIMRLVQSFRNDAFVYFLTELVTGGEVLEALQDLGLLNWSQAQFYTGSIVLALEHLHDKRIAYLDLKSENILIDHQGYIKLIDFGLSVKMIGAQSHHLRGSPHFMAPEMILGQGYDTAVDLWSLGVCLYEFMIGTLPFGNGSSAKSEIFGAVLKGVQDFPSQFKAAPGAEASTSMIRGLLTQNPKHRLGGGRAGYKDIKEHLFFTEFHLDDLLARHIKPPYVPRSERYTETEGKDMIELVRRGQAKGRSLAEVEEECERQALKKGWRDPTPGWDDDFDSG
jgi:cGMP-dependent protein kinase